MCTHSQSVSRLMLHTYIQRHSSSILLISSSVSLPTCYISFILFLFSFYFFSSQTYSASTKPYVTQVPIYSTILLRLSVGIAMSVCTLQMLRSTKATRKTGGPCCLTPPLPNIFTRVIIITITIILLTNIFVLDMDTLFRYIYISYIFIHILFYFPDLKTDPTLFSPLKLLDITTHTKR